MTGSEKEAKAPTNPIAKMGEKVFKVYERKSTWLAEFRCADGASPSGAGTVCHSCAYMCDWRACAGRAACSS